MSDIVSESNGFKLNEIVLYKKDKHQYRIFDWRLNNNNIDGVVLDLASEFIPYFIMVSFEDIEKIKIDSNLDS